jgi:carboxyvinyl-carboxyphosphonate phosphorylmutase
MGSLLRGRIRPQRTLRDLLAGPEMVVAPGAYDALSARLVEAGGFPVVYMSGFGASASMLGRPDVGLATLTEMAGSARRIAQAVDVPVIADADTGYGNVINVIRTVREYEQAGVAGIHLEDQVTPKRCGHMAGKEVIPAEEMVGKIRAAVAARADDDFVIIARTDAAIVEGLPAAIQRAERYFDSGADMLFVEAPTSEREIETVATALGHIPLVFNWAEKGLTPPIPLERVRELGFKLVIFPSSTLYAATAGIRQVLEAIRGDGTPQRAMVEIPGFTEFVDFIGLPEVQDAEDRYGGGH